MELTELLMQDVLTEARSLSDKLNLDANKFPESSIRNKAMPIIDRLCRVPATRQLISELMAKDLFTYRHCIGVAILSFGIGSWSGMGEETLRELTVAGFLHDIGKVKVHHSILKKAGPLTPDEYSDMCLHTLSGFDVLRGTPGLTERQALVALQHHERADGSGYPFGIAGDKITEFSKVVAIADVFHAMVSERVYKRPASLYQALKELYVTTTGLFDAKLTRCFVTHLMNLAIDSKVLLSNGQIVRIVRLHADDLIRPIVQARGKLLDIRKSGLEIVDFPGGDPNVRSV